MPPPTVCPGDCLRIFHPSPICPVLRHSERQGRKDTPDSGGMQVCIFPIKLEASNLCVIRLDSVVLVAYDCPEFAMHRRMAGWGKWGSKRNARQRVSLRRNWLAWPVSSRIPASTNPRFRGWNGARRPTPRSMCSTRCPAPFAVRVGTSHQKTYCLVVVTPFFAWCAES